MWVRMFIDAALLLMDVFVDWLGSWLLAEGGSCFFPQFLVLPPRWHLYTYNLQCASFLGAYIIRFLPCPNFHAKLCFEGIAVPLKQVIQTLIMLLLIFKNYV